MKLCKHCLLPIEPGSIMAWTHTNGWNGCLMANNYRVSLPHGVFATPVELTERLF